MNTERQIYLLNPKELSPETIAVTFAKTSRSPQTFREIAAELTDEQSAKFHEKWVVGYGHASVAEHAVLHIAVENVSRLAIESIEGNRLASYTEKSTRYQKWDPEKFYIPRELDSHSLRDVYIETCQRLFAAYQQSLPAVSATLKADVPLREGESEAAWDRRVRSQYVDVCRYLLPAASLANVGITANARVLEHAIAKMLSDPLQEVQEIGREIKAVALAEVPTLVKYADQLPYLMTTSRFFEQEQVRLDGEAARDEEWCRLVSFDPHGEEAVLAAAVYRFGEMSYPQACAAVQQAGPEEKERLVCGLLGELGKHDVPLRELELTNYVFDVLVDQGGYFELKRHRMMTQTPQPLTTRNGYTIPQRVVLAGFEPAYREAMDIAAEVYEKLAAFNPHLAGYVVPNGFKRRVLLGMNLRTAFHFCALRSAENAHFSMRRLALRIAEQIRQVHPLLGAFLQIDTKDSWQEIEARYFSQA